MNSSQSFFHFSSLVTVPLQVFKHGASCSSEQVITLCSFGVRALPDAHIMTFLGTSFARCPYGDVFGQELCEMPIW